MTITTKKDTSLKSLLEKEVQLRETATKELNKEIQAAAIKKFEAISQIEALEEGYMICKAIFKIERKKKERLRTERGRKEAKKNTGRIFMHTIVWTLLTTIAAASAAAEGIAAAMKGKGEVRSLQSYHASIA